jgi:hypothetical protein
VRPRRRKAAQAFLNAASNYQLLAGVQTNLYKCFLVRAWEIRAAGGVTGLIHQDGIFDDPKGGALREAVFRGCAGSFRFKNELQLFVDVGHVRPICPHDLRSNRTGGLRDAVQSLPSVDGRSLSRA